MDIWGLCPSCDRWFRCEGWFDRTAPHPACRHCDAEPVAIENRLARALVVTDPAPG
jgi:hypothetical protein